jgi:hypothetical protein
MTALGRIVGGHRPPLQKTDYGPLVRMLFGFELRRQCPFAARAGVMPNLILAVDRDDCASTAADTFRNLRQRHTRGRKQ